MADGSVGYYRFFRVGRHCGLVHITHLDVPVHDGSSCAGRILPLCSSSASEGDSSYGGTDDCGWIPKYLVCLFHSYVRLCLKMFPEIHLVAIDEGHIMLA